jgi:hypothetical protein
MQKDKSSQGIVLDERSQGQPADKERTQKTSKTKPGHIELHPVLLTPA